MAEEAVAEVAAETFAGEMAKNVTEEGAETEIVTVKLAETMELLKKKGPQLLVFWFKFSTFN